ncbi:hypothetical protein MRX96_005548 [Rhipicephalus microplus]
MATFSYGDNDLVQEQSAALVLGVPKYVMPSIETECRCNIDTHSDQSSTLPLTREVVKRPYVVPVTGASRPLPEPEEMWEAGTPATYKPRRPPVAQVFRQLHGPRPSERRLYYRSLFQNGPPRHHAPPKQPKVQHIPPCSNQQTNAVHAQAETRQPRGTYTQDIHPPFVHAVVGNQHLGGEASPTPVWTGADPYNRTTTAKRGVDVNEVADRLEELGCVRLNQK